MYLEQQLHTLNTREQASNNHLRDTLLAYLQEPSWHRLRSAVHSRIALKKTTVLVRAFGLFDGTYYIQHGPGPSDAGIDPLVHYLLIGWRRLYNPGPRFDTFYYLSRNTDVLLSGLNPLEHYVRFGRHEGRRGMAD